MPKLLQTRRITGFTAVVHLPLAEVTTISFVRTLFTTILAILFLKEVVGVRRWSSVIVGFIGVLVIVRPEPENINAYALLAIASAFFVLSINIVTRKLVVSDSWWKLVFGVAPDHDGCSIRRRGQSAS